MSRILILSLLSISVMFAQPTKSERPPEAQADVPALTEFHEVIAQIWHTAWPNKDTDLLVRLMSDVERGALTVAKAKLPAILHEREEKWREGVRRLQEIVGEYKAASDPLVADKLLAAAEKLHMQYEALVRVVRPALKELDDFHGSLYLLYHYALPEKDMQRIHVLVEELKAKMAKLSAATLPARHKERAEAFAKARTALGESVTTLYKAVPGATVESLKPLIEDMHSKYENLDKVFQ